MEDITIGLISAGLSSSALDDGRSLDGDRADILAKILTGERDRVLSSCSDDDDVASDAMELYSSSNDDSSDDDSYGTR